MNVRLHFVAALAAAAFLVGAAPAPYGAPPPPQQPAVTGFHHDPKLDVFGYYIPEGEVKIGKWVLSSLDIGTPQDFIDYEKGKRDPPEYAPLMIEFNDVTSPQRENELGGMYYTNERRVLPTAYAIAGNRVSFVAKDAVLGNVIFTGILDIAAVKRATAAAGQTSDTSIVLTGDLIVGSHVLKNLKFTWFGGD